MQHHIHVILSSVPWVFSVAAFIGGAFAGSFLNVCIARLPPGGPGAGARSHSRSHCRACGATIPWRFRIPVLGWFISRGRARCCGVALPFRHVFVELLAGALFVACWQVFAPHSVAKALCGMVFAGALACATFTDLDRFEIPNALTIGLAVFGVVASFATPSLHGQAHEVFAIASLRSGLLALAGIAVGSGLLFWIACLAEALLRKEAMGLQDVLFVGAIGAFCGWQGAVFSIFGGAMIGSLWIAGAVAWGKIRGKKITVKSLDANEPPSELAPGSDVPFGPMLAGGALVYFFWLHTWFDARLADFARLLWP